MSQTAPLGEASRREFYRKFLHSLPGVFPFLLAVIEHPDPLTTIDKVVVVTICVILTAVFLALFKVVQREGEHDLLLTVLSYPACVVATLLLFPAHAEFAGVVVAVLAFGDTAAYIGGKSIGGPPLPWNPKKTIAGSVAFVAAAAPLATLAYWAEARSPGMSQALFQVPFALAATCGVSAAVAGAIAESWKTELTDNLRVGIAAAAAVAIAHFSYVGIVSG